MNPIKENHDLNPDRSRAAWDSILECMFSRVNQAQLIFSQCWVTIRESCNIYSTAVSTQYVSSNIYVHSHRHNIAGTKLFCKKKSPLKSQPCRLQCLYWIYSASYPSCWPPLTNSIFDPQRKIVVLENHATFCQMFCRMQMNTSPPIP